LNIWTAANRVHLQVMAPVYLKSGMLEELQTLAGTPVVPRAVMVSPATPDNVYRPLPTGPTPNPRADPTGRTQASRVRRDSLPARSSAGRPVAQRQMCSRR
jgi:hypothetical protein